MLEILTSRTKMKWFHTLACQSRFSRLKGIMRSVCDNRRDLLLHNKDRNNFVRLSLLIHFKQTRPTVQIMDYSCTAFPMIILLTFHIDLKLSSLVLKGVLQFNCKHLYVLPLYKNHQSITIFFFKQKQIITVL